MVVMGGEGSSGVFAQVEAYDPATNKWESFAPMPTPRHGMGAVAIGDAIYVAGGGPVTGGSLMTSTNEAFTLASGSSQK
ncbi:kelch repeat-containing protein [Scytonema sp. UIC 10036]|uniref:kelch repeat-containing protein n=1 Tax=Scytonema sp. UIC 10036 TaxID=2304196 RepID=UPI00325B7336